MRGMERLQLIKLAGLVGLVCTILGAAPAPPSYLGVERTIDNIRQSWSSPGAPPQPNRAGWDVLFDALLGDLKAYAKAESETDRVEVARSRLSDLERARHGPVVAGRDPARRNQAMASAPGSPGVRPHAG